MVSATCDFCQATCTSPCPVDVAFLENWKEQDENMNESNNNPSSVQSRLRWKLTLQSGVWKWTLFEGETELGSIKLGGTGYGWYIESTGRWGIMIHYGRRFEKLSEAAKRLHRYWTNETWRPAAQATEVA